MSKLKQKIVLFIEPAEFAWTTSSKIGNLFMNRFAIDEDANHEILKICYLKKRMSDYFDDDSDSWIGHDLRNHTIITYDS